MGYRYEKITSLDLMLGNIPKISKVDHRKCRNKHDLGVKVNYTALVQWVENSRDQSFSVEKKQLLCYIYKTKIVAKDIIIISMEWRKKWSPFELK